MKRLTKIIATIGPASNSEEVIKKLLKAGVDVFRFNLSHGTKEEHQATLRLIRKIASRSKKQVGILFDVADPKLRSLIKRGARLTGNSLSTQTLTKKVYADVEFAIKQKVDWLALSFVRQRSDVAKLKRILKNKKAAIKVMAKIEKKEAVEDINAIINEADAVMIARGDLGVEVAIEEVPIIQKKVINKCMRRGKAVVTATQMLESMITNPRPTRAEVNDVANAIFDQTDAVMLSAETAIGKYPVIAVETMAKVAAKTESAINYGKLLADKIPWVSTEVTDAISFVSCELVNDVSAALLVTSTQSGSTAQRVASYRPPAPILAVTPSQDVLGKLKLIWGVMPFLIKPTKDINDMFAKAKKAAVASSLVRKNDRIVITAGALVNLPGTTNLIKVDSI